MGATRAIAIAVLAACGDTASPEEERADGASPPAADDAAGGADAAALDEPTLIYPYVMQVEFAPALAPDGTILVQGKRAVYTPEGGPTLLALSPAGELLWGAVTDPGAVPAPPASIQDGVVLAPAALPGADNGRVYRFMLDGGEALAPIDVTGPVTDGVAVGLRGAFYVPATPLEAVVGGATDWSFPMVAGGKTGSNAAVGPSGTIYVGGRGVSEHNLHAVNADGSEKWARDVGASIIDPIAVDAEERIYALNGDGRFVVYEASGDLAWSIQLDSYNSGGGIVLGPDGTAYVGTIGTSAGSYTSEYLFALRDGGGGAGEIVWRQLVGLSWIGTTPALSAGGTLYVSDFCRELAAVRAADGEVRWSYRIPGLGEDECAGFSSPVIAADGTVYAWNEGPAGEGRAGGGLYAFPGDGTGPADSPWPQEGADASHSNRVTAGDP